MRERLSLPRHAARALEAESSGPGNALCVLLDGNPPELVTAFGEAGRPAEDVAQDVVRQATQHLAAAAPVGEHLADQLLLLLLLGGGAFRTQTLSSHARTNIEVIRCFAGVQAIEVEDSAGTTLVRCMHPLGR